MVLGYAYYWTKSIWYPIILHFLNNGLQTLILFFSGGQLAEAEETIKTPETSQFVIVVIISCFLCYLLIKNIKLKISERNMNMPRITTAVIIVLAILTSIYFGASGLTTLFAIIVIFGGFELSKILDNPRSRWYTNVVF